MIDQGGLKGLMRMEYVAGLIGWKTRDLRDLMRRTPGAAFKVGSRWYTTPVGLRRLDPQFYAFVESEAARRAAAE